MQKRMNTLIINSLWYIAVCILLSIFVLSVCYHTTISYDVAEKVTIHCFGVIYMFISPETGHMRAPILPAVRCLSLPLNTAIGLLLCYTC